MDLVRISSKIQAPGRSQSCEGPRGMKPPMKQSITIWLYDINMYKITIRFQLVIDLTWPITPLDRCIHIYTWASIHRGSSKAMVIHSHEMREVLLVTASCSSREHRKTASAAATQPTFSHQATQFHQLSSTSETFQGWIEQRWVIPHVILPKAPSAAQPPGANSQVWSCKLNCLNTLHFYRQHSQEYHFVGHFWHQNWIQKTS